ncbi:MAG TPA: hypothetical protein VHC22_18475 [Pirellulales bacterium]|nr:hypothetical protein [Pirellulales bacterium]
MASATLPESPDSDNGLRAHDAASTPNNGGGPKPLPASPPTADSECDLLGFRGVVSEMHQYAEEIERSWRRLGAEDRKKVQAAVHELGRAAGGNTPRQGRMFALGIALAGLWLVVFAVGFAIPVSPYMAELDATHIAATSSFETLRATFMVILCSTPTNPGILACIAALLGGIANWTHVDGSQPNKGDSHASIQRVCFAPMLRGFFMYLTLLGGLLLLTTQAITKATQDQYVQLAGTVSVFAFMIGYDPDVFRKLMGKVNGWASQHENATPPNDVASSAHCPSDAEAPAVKKSAEPAAPAKV